MTEPTRSIAEELVVFVLREPGYLSGVVAAFEQAGLRDVEVVESQGVAEIANEEIPIFASFRHVFTGAQSYNYVVMASAAPAQRAALIEALETLLAEVSDSQRGVMWCLPLVHVHRLGGST